MGSRKMSEECSSGFAEVHGQVGLQRPLHLHCASAHLLPRIKFLRNSMLNREEIINNAGSAGARG
jgi:hypothetical protein